MQRALLIMLVLVLGTAQADARRRHHHHSYADPYGPSAVAVEGSHRDDATGSRWIPQGWQLEPADPNWKGRRYMAPDGSAWLALYASHAGRETVAAHKKAIALVPGEQITYLRKSRDWIAVSGFKDRRIFYRRAALACGGQSWHHVAFEYPADQKRKMDGVVTRLSRILGSLRHEGCQPTISSR